MKFYSYKDLKKASKTINITSMTRLIYLKLRYLRLKKELEETEKAILWEVLKNGR